MAIMLGDLIENALTSVGVSKERVEKYVGNCGCEERKRRINTIDAWARRTISGFYNRSKEYLEEILSDG